MGEKIKSIGAYGILLAAVMAGLTAGVLYSQHNLTRIQEDYSRAKEELSDAKSELSKANTELAASTSSSSKGLSNLAPSPIPTETKTIIPAISSALSTPPSAPPSSSNEQTLSIADGETAKFFDGEILVSLVATPLEGNPLRHKVSAIVGGSEVKNVSIAEEDIGYVVTLRGSESSYSVRVLSASIFYASFSVTKTPIKSDSKHLK